MCGRIALYTEPERLSRVFDAAMAAGVDAGDLPRFNVGPTTEIFGIIDAGSPPDTAGSRERLLDRFRWGLIPWWSTEATSGGRLFNARAESVSTKAAFRDAFRVRRAIIPADGFFEWRKERDGSGIRPGGKSQPYFFTREDRQPMALAGLWEVWRDPLGPDDRSAWITLVRHHHHAGRAGRGLGARTDAGDPRTRGDRGLAGPVRRCRGPRGPHAAGSGGDACPSCGGSAGRERSQ